MTEDYKLLRSVIMFNHNNGQVQKNNATALSTAISLEYDRINGMIINMKNRGVVDLSWGIAHPILDKSGRMMDINRNRKAVVGVNKKTGNQIRFLSCYAASKFLSIPRPNISACCNCKYGYKSAGGYEWRFEYE